MRVIFFDTECLQLPGTPKEGEGDGLGEWSFDRPWELGLAVAATTEKGEGGRQWLAEDAADLVYYFAQADVVAGFNCLRFDFPLVEGEWGRQVHGHYEERDKTLAEDLAEESGILLVDMLLDVWDSLGKRMKGTGLKPLSVHTLGKVPGMEGALAPVAWKDHRKAEVISYCADDVEWSRELFNHGLKTGNLKRPASFKGDPLDPSLGSIEFPIVWNIRTAGGEVVEPFRDWATRYLAEASAGPFPAAGDSS
jgi:hypothetical protein